MASDTVEVPGRSGWLQGLHDRFAQWVGNPGFWAVFVAVGMIVPMVRSIRTPLPPPLPVLATLPAFQFTNQYGQPFGSEQLKGQVWIANFIFTRCPTVCPMFTERMGTLQHRGRNLGQAFHLVSFSVDPEYDTPARLLAYAQKHKVSPRMWTFLTGDSAAMKKTVVDGLKISMGREGPEDDFSSIFHGTHFVLIDQLGRIRGYYQSSDDDAVERLLRDTGLLVNRGN